MAVYWFGIVSEFDPNATFARKLRVFVASEETLDLLEKRLPPTEERTEGFQEFFKAKEKFVQYCEKELPKMKLDKACEKEEVKDLVQCMKKKTGGFMPADFQNGHFESPRNGLKRWQGIVEMAHIYADGDADSERGGGLLMPFNIPVDKATETILASRRGSYCSVAESESKLFG